MIAEAPIYPALKALLAKVQFPLLARTMKGISFSSLVVMTLTFLHASNGSAISTLPMIVCP
jgi:hypothetical protein